MPLPILNMTKLVAEATASIGDTITRTFFFYADGEVLYHDDGSEGYCLYTNGWPFILDRLYIYDEKLFTELFLEWDD